MGKRLLDFQAFELLPRAMSNVEYVNRLGASTLDAGIIFRLSKLIRLHRVAIPVGTSSSDLAQAVHQTGHDAVSFCPPIGNMGSEGVAL